MNYAAERARLLFGCYRKGDANDPDTYVAAVTAVLAGYPVETIRYITDPRSGLPSTVTFMPSVAEVVAACEEHYGPRRRAEDRRIRVERQLAERERMAIPDYRPKSLAVRQYSYREFLEHYGPNARAVGRFETKAEIERDAGKPVAMPKPVEAGEFIATSALLDVIKPT